MKKQILLIVAAALFCGSVVSAQIKVNPNGVNVNATGSTTVFLTFGRLVNQVPAEAYWCGELVSAAPAIGLKGDPNTIFGSLPTRYDLSTINSSGAFTDIMSIPPSVARRAYQAAEQGALSSFFYVRRFVSTAGGPDEYVAVTCRMAGGGARVPFALQSVVIAAETEAPVLLVKKDEAPSKIAAEIHYNGTGQLEGRWEVVLPGEEPPAARDLLTEATLPVEERGLQRRYTELSRFNVFLPPTGHFILPGPDVSKMPAAMNGLYMILLRIEATDDKEGDSNLAAIGLGEGLIHSGAVAGFPMPIFHYFVGNVEREMMALTEDAVQLLAPEDEAVLPREGAIDFSWIAIRPGAIYRLEVKDSAGQQILSALLRAGIEFYRAPSWLNSQAAGSKLHWRITALNFAGNEIAKSEWRRLLVTQTASLQTK